MVVRLAIGQLLLVNTSISSTFRATTLPIPVVAGYGKFDPSIDPAYKTGLLFSFLTMTYGFLTDPTQTYSFPPITPACHSDSDGCLSVVMPGFLEGISPNPRATLNNDFSSGTAYVVDNAMGIQFEYYSSNVTYQEADCRIFSASRTAVPVALCLKGVDKALNFGSSLIFIKV